MSRGGHDPGRRPFPLGGRGGGDGQIRFARPAPRIAEGARSAGWAPRAAPKQQRAPRGAGGRLHSNPPSHDGAGRRRESPRTASPATRSDAGAGPSAIPPPNGGGIRGRAPARPQASGRRPVPPAADGPRITRLPRRPWNGQPDRNPNRDEVLRAGLDPSAELSLKSTSERWPSGRRRTPGKCVGGQPSRGFESLPLRQHMGTAAPRWTLVGVMPNSPHTLFPARVSGVGRQRSVP